LGAACSSERSNENAVPNDPRYISERIEIVADKPGKGAFYATGLGDELAARAITHLVVAGVTTEVCVQTTMREANDRGFDCLLIEDATESYFPEFKRATLAMIRAQGGIVGWTAPLAALERALT
jgi:nicotinamidase-related amidase